MDFGSQARVDEDEGSPLQNGVNQVGGRAKPIRDANLGKSKDQRKPSGSAMTRHSFPPDETLNINPASDRGDKGQGVANVWVERAGVG